MRRFFDSLLIVLFLLAIAAPLVAMLLAEAPHAHASERRRSVAPPPLSLEPQALISLPAQWNDYFNDSFGLRRALIRAHCILKVEYLNVSSSRKVILGEEGWLFLEESLALHRAPALTEAELKRWKQVLETRRDWLRRRGIRYVPVLVPDKCTVYPEFLPEKFRRGAMRSRLRQLLAFLRASSDLEMLDLLELLREAKPRGVLYFKTDSHWNDHGAYLAYRAILERINEWYPESRAAPSSGFLPVEDRFSGDLAGMLDLEDRLSEVRVRLVPRSPRGARVVDERGPVTECARGEIPRTVVFCDSFGQMLRPFLAEHFGRTVSVRSRTLDALVIDEEKPDIVIHEIVERFLRRVPVLTVKP